MDFMLTSQKVFLLLLAATGYAVASILMKLMAQGGGPNQGMALGFVLGLFLVLTVLAEVRLLRQMDLSNVYITIIAIETLIVLGYAVWAGEALSTREIAGGAMVIAGTLLVA